MVGAAAGWFKPNQVHPLEKAALPEYFNGLNDGVTVRGKGITASSRKFSAFSGSFGHNQVRPTYRRRLHCRSTSMGSTMVSRYDGRGVGGFLFLYAGGGGGGAHPHRLATHNTAE